MSENEIRKERGEGHDALHNLSGDRLGDDVATLSNAIEDRAVLRAEVARLTREVAEAREALTQNARDAIGVINDLALERQRCAAAESALSEARAEVESLRKALALETHKVITCGVAASHPDAGLSLRGVYGGEWNSPQAEEVRTLRTNHDEARAALSEAQAEVQRLKAEKCKGCQETIARHREAEDQRAAANVALSEAREVVRNCATQMAHASMFVQSREKMHVAGLALFLSASESARSWLARLDAQGVTK